MSAHIWGMDKKTRKAVSAAAVTIPMGWMVQPEKPRMKAVQAAFMDAAGKLPENAGYDIDTVRAGLISVAAGTDARGGTFMSQAIRAAAALHDVNARLTEQSLA